MVLSRRALLASAVSATLAMGGCVSNQNKGLLDSLGNAEYKNMNPNLKTMKTVPAKIGPEVGLKELGMEKFETVFITPEAAGDWRGSSRFYINGIPFRGNAGNGTVESFIPAPYGYMVLVKQNGGTCQGRELPDRPSLVFYKVGKSGDIKGEVACVPNRDVAEFITTKDAIYYPAELRNDSRRNTLVKSWVGIKPDGTKVAGPKLVAQALPLGNGKWNLNDREKQWLWDEKTKQRKKIGFDTVLKYTMPPAIYVNMPPYQSSYVTNAFTPEWYEYAGNAITRYQPQGGAWGAQILDQTHPIKCYGRIGRVCNPQLWLPVYSRVVGKMPEFPIYSAFVWGNGKQNAYMATFDPDGSSYTCTLNLLSEHFYG